MTGMLIHLNLVIKIIVGNIRIHGNVSEATILSFIWAINKHYKNKPVNMINRNHNFQMNFQMY